MRVALRPVVALIALIGLTACGSDDKAAAIVMPEVTGRQLDVALSDIKSAGFDDEVDVEGGGTFGVVDESNWTVCEQTPAAGKSIGDAPRLTVDRSCGDEPAEDTGEDTAPTSEPAPEAAAPETTAPAVQAPLTAASNPELAALLTGPDCDASVAAFATKYRGMPIEFDGSVGAMNNHADYDTRYDILVSYGDFSETKSYGGPNFQFRDVGISDLHLAGSDSIAVGANLHVVAEVGEFVENQCLFLLDPVTTTVR